MKNLSLIASALAMLGLTACEKGLVDGVADVAPAGQAAKSVLPTTDDAAATSAIALREGHNHGDLMAAQALVLIFPFPSVKKLAPFGIRR